MPKKTQPNKKPDPNQIDAIGKPNEDEALAIARTVIRPSVQAAVTMKEYGKSLGNLELSGLIDALAAQTKAVTDGDLGRGEAALVVQAHTLDAIFNNLARRAIKADYMNNLDTYLKLALRAQSQCRATWEAVSAIKNPPMVGFVGQANIAHGPQQVNNAPVSDRGTAPAGKKEKLQNKLLENDDGQRLDIGEASSPVQADPAMAPVGKVDRAKDSGG